VALSAPLTDDWELIALQLQALVDELLERERRLLILLNQSTEIVNQLSGRLEELAAEISGGLSSDIA
jgi:hypothetical protein